MHLVTDARYGHFTAVQARGGRVRGLALHLDRLTTADKELFGRELDRDLVLDSIRTVLAGAADASVRVYLTQACVLTTARPPKDVAKTPRNVRTEMYQRFLPHIKHTGGFPQAYLGLRAAAEGYDEVLFTAGDGRISEGSITNVGCFDGTRVIWPEAPMLRGIAMALMEEGLDRAGVPYEHRMLKDLRGFEAVFLTNSHGVVPVGRVDGVPLRVDERAVRRLIDCYESTPWDQV